MNIYSVSSLEYKRHAKAPMEMFDNSTGLFLGSLDFFPYYGRCSAPGAPFAGEAWLQLSNAKGSKRVTSADRAMRTSLFQPWMEFNILNTCDGIDATGNVINQNGYLVILLFIVSIVLSILFFIWIIYLPIITVKRFLIWIKTTTF